MTKIYKYKDSILEKIRKFNAIIRQSQIHRVKVYIMLFLVTFSAMNNIFAIENNNIEYGDYQIFCDIDEYSYISYNGIGQINYQYYYIKDSIKYPVYCIDLYSKGAQDTDNGYLVGASSKIEDEVLKSILLNCYPYKSIEEIGVDTVSQAQFASQFAIWIYTDNLDVNLINARSSEYEKVVTAIKQIYNNGISNVGTYNIDFDSSISNQDTQVIDNIVYYTKDIDFNSISNIYNIEVISQDSNIKIVKNSDDSYKVYVPVDIVDNEYTVTLNLNLTAKENAILMGISSISGYQNVALTLNTTFEFNTNLEIKFDSIKSKIKINKYDLDTNMPLRGVIYDISDSEGNIIGTYSTDEDGSIILYRYNTINETLYINEIATNENYIIDTSTYEVSIIPNDEVEINLYNEKEKGQIQIIKKTKEYNELTNIEENMPLEGVVFNIYDENMQYISTMTTDKYGYAISSKLSIGKYYIEEYSTVEGYKLLADLIEINLTENNEILTIEVLNENVEIENKLPVTGK